MKQIKNLTGFHTFVRLLPSVPLSFLKLSQPCCHLDSPPASLQFLSKCGIWFLSLSQKLKCCCQWFLCPQLLSQTDPPSFMRHFPAHLQWHPTLLLPPSSLEDFFPFLSFFPDDLIHSHSLWCHHELIIPNPALLSFLLDPRPVSQIAFQTSTPRSSSKCKKYKSNLSFFSLNTCSSLGSREPPAQPCH